MGLNLVLSGLSFLPEIEIVTFDAYGILNDLVSDAEAFGLSVVDGACVTPNEPPFECKVPDGYLFWDGIHPTKAVHAISATRRTGPGAIVSGVRCNCRGQISQYKTE